MHILAQNKTAARVPSIESVDIRTLIFVEQQNQMSDKATNTVNKYKENNAVLENFSSEITKFKKELDDLRISAENLETAVKQLVNDDEMSDGSVSSKPFLSHNGNYLVIKSCIKITI